MHRRGGAVPAQPRCDAAMWLHAHRAASAARTPRPRSAPAATSSAGRGARPGPPPGRPRTARAPPASAAVRAPSAAPGGPPTAARSAPSTGRGSGRSACGPRGSPPRRPSRRSRPPTPARRAVQPDRRRPVARHAQHPGPRPLDRGVAGSGEQRRSAAAATAPCGAAHACRSGHDASTRTPCERRPTDPGAATRTGTARRGRRARSGRPRCAARRRRRARRRRAPPDPSQPMSAHARAGSGAVTISEEFIGSQVRRSPGRRAVNPSVARTTNRAVTDAAVGLHPPGPQRGHPRVLEDLDAPGLARRGPARPPAAPGCTRAACGCQAAPRRPGTATRARAASASSSSTSVSPHRCSAATAACSRAHCAALRGDGQLPAAGDPGVDALGRDDPQHLVDGVVQRHLQRGARRRRPCVRTYRSAAAGDRVGQPPAVAARGPVAREPLLQHDDAQLRRRPRQVVGGPRARCSPRRRRRRRRPSGRAGRADPIRAATARPTSSENALRWSACRTSRRAGRAGTRCGRRRGPSCRSTSRSGSRTRSSARPAAP